MFSGGSCLVDSHGKLGRNSVLELSSSPPLLPLPRNIRREISHEPKFARAESFREGFILQSCVVVRQIIQKIGGVVIVLALSLIFLPI